MSWDIKNQEVFDIISDYSGVSVEELEKLEEYQIVLMWCRWVGDNSFDGYLDEFIECLINRVEELEMEIE